MSRKEKEVHRSLTEMNVAEIAAHLRKSGYLGGIVGSSIREARELAERYAGPRNWKKGLYVNTIYRD